MNDQNFEKMDQEMMKSTQPLREKRVSGGMLKGFSASVERRLETKKQAPARAFSPVWIPAFAVMILAAVVALRPPVTQSMDYAQLEDADVNIEAEIEALKELGVWDENDDSLLGTLDTDLEELEYSYRTDRHQSSIA